MVKVFAVYFETQCGERYPDVGTQRVYAETPHAAAIEAGAILAVPAPATATIREVVG